MGVILHAHPVRGESHIQCNANREVATIQASSKWSVVRKGWKPLPEIFDCLLPFFRTWILRYLCLTFSGDWTNLLRTKPAGTPGSHIAGFRSQARLRRNYSEIVAFLRGATFRSTACKQSHTVEKISICERHRRWWKRLKVDFKKYHVF